MASGLLPVCLPGRSGVVQKFRSVNFQFMLILKNKKLHIIEHHCITAFVVCKVFLRKVKVKIVLNGLYMVLKKMYCIQMPIRRSGKHIIFCFFFRL